MMRRRFLAMLLGVLALAAGPLTSAAPAAPSQVVAPSGEPLTIDVSKGIILRLERPAANIFVADPDVADIQVKSPTVIYLVGKAAGETTLFAVDQQDRVLINSRVEVHHNAGRLQRALRELVPGSKVEVKPLDDSVVLEGTAYSAAEAEDVRRIAARFVPDAQQLINKMQLDAPNQINLRVRIAEVSRDVIKKVGINWDNVYGGHNFLFGLATGNPVLAANGLFATRRQIGAGSVDSLFGKAHSGRFDLNTVIDALEQEGLVTVLAEPNLTAVSGEPASFLAGGEYPIPVPSSSSNAISINYKKFGVSLSFVATILDRDRINLRVEPEVSQLSASGGIVIDSISVPALTTRRAETTVELGSGQSFAIAGLLQNNVTQDLAKFPWLGDLPVLGALFRSTQFQRNETELVIIVTPYIVKPVSAANRLLAPTDGFVPPTDQQRVSQGALFRQQPAKLAVGPPGQAQVPRGTVGFEID